MGALGRIQILIEVAMRWKGHDWEDCYPPVSEKVLDDIERELGVVLPKDYKECARICHGGRPVKDAFTLHDPDIGEMESCAGVLLALVSDHPEGLLPTFRRLKGHLPEGVIPIVDDGGGDFVCLDYRGGLPPGVGYWHQGDDLLIPLAGSFSEFLELLYE